METTDDLPKTDERSIAVRLRDNNRCQICHCGKTRVNLEIHAIVPDDEEAITKMANYVLLCEKHHQKAHTIEESPKYGR